MRSCKRAFLRIAAASAAAGRRDSLGYIYAPPLPDTMASSARPSTSLLPWLVIALAVILLDQLSKTLVIGSFALGDSLTLTSFFNLVRVHNTGAAFSFLAGASGWQRWFFVGLGAAAALFIVWLLRSHGGQRLFGWALALILGGALGNVEFRTSEIEKVAADIGISSVKTSDFYYEMVVNRSNNKIRQLAEDKGFQLLLKLLRGSVEKLAYDRKLQGISLSHRKVAEFFDLDLQKASDLLKETEFELLFYPEWVNKVLGII